MVRVFVVLGWCGFAVGAVWLGRLRADVVALWAWRVSGTLAMALALVVQVVFANPVFDHDDLGRLPIANGLLLAYAVPAAMAALARRWIDLEPNKNVAVLVGGGASFLAFGYVSLEV